ncbi:alpha/beta fold hydrolase [Micromonospora sp. NPDC048063]|uniref:alpha/beta fold hydrolase n=1 Tax=Micromonospora sp. NPDC048063 TaxID=3364256 RepID=UPI003719CCE0
MDWLQLAGQTLPSTTVRTMLPLHVTTWDAPHARDDQVILIHGTMTWGLAAFAAQQPLAGHRRILVVDRRGFGASPDTEQSDYDVDADDIVGLMDRPTHLVGHSYGGVVALLAAVRRPELLRSLALIEPSALAVAADHPVVAAALRNNRRYVAAARSMSAEEYLLAAYGADQPVPEPWEFAVRAAGTALRERPCWEADLPVDALRSHDCPKLVLAGTWETAQPDYRSSVGEALIVTAGIVASRIGARLHRVSGADHAPHQQRPEQVNRLLLQLWDEADIAASARSGGGGQVPQTGGRRIDD